jgi:hypothetical protein
MYVTNEEAALRDWLATRPVFILMNGDLVPEPKAADIPAAILDRLDGRRPDFLVLREEELRSLGIALSHDQQRQFQSGQPVLFAVGYDALPPGLKRGRREKQLLERQVQDALAIQVYVTVERLCELVKKRDGRRCGKTLPALRDEMFKTLAKDAWIDEHASEKAEEDRRISFFKTQYDAGSRLLCQFYPGASSPREIAVRVRESSIAEYSELGGMAALNLRIASDAEWIRFLVQCLRQATSLVLAVQQIADAARRERVPPGVSRRIAAGLDADRPFLVMAVRAGLDCDFNAGDIFRSLLSHHDLFETARLFGRYFRGQDVRFEPPHVRVLARQFPRGLPFIGRELRPADLTDEDGAAIQITRTMLDIRPAEEWPPLLEEALAAHSAIAISRRRDDVAA